MRLRIQLKVGRHFYLKSKSRVRQSPPLPPPTHCIWFFVIFLLSLSLKRFKIRNKRLGTTDNKRNGTPGAIPKTVHEALPAMGRKVEQVYYNPQSRSWTLLQMWQTRTCDGMLLPTLKAFAHPTRSLHATRNTWCFQSACSSRTASRSRQQQSSAPPPQSSTLLRTAPDTSTRIHGGDHLLDYDVFLLWNELTSFPLTVWSLTTHIWVVPHR